MTRPAGGVVDTDSIDEGRRSWPAVLAALLVGAVLGVLVGGLYAASQPKTYEATTALSVQPDPTLDITANANSNNSTAALDATAYIQSQLVVINGQQLAGTVRDQLGLSASPQVTATQVGETYVVSIQASSTSRATALRIARSVASNYDRIRTRQLTSEINAFLSSVRGQLTSVQQSLATGSTRRGTQLTPSEVALQTQYEQLLSERSSLDATLSQVGKIVTVVTPASIATGGLSAVGKGGLGGLVVGAILGLVVLVVYRRSIHRIRSVSDLAALSVPVLLPVQARRSWNALAAPKFWQHPAARLLAARLYADALRFGKPLVVVGATSGVGTTQVAATISAALAGRGPVLLVGDPAAPMTRDTDATDAPVPDDDEAFLNAERVPVVASTVANVFLLPPERRDPAEPPAWRLMDLVQRATRVGWLVVIDAGALPDSDLAAQLARIDAAVALVVGRGASSPSEVLAATELFEAEGMSSTGVVLNDIPGWYARTVRRLLGRRAARITAAGDATEPGLPSDSPLWESLLDDGQAREGGHRASVDGAFSAATRYGGPSPTS